MSEEEAAFTEAAEEQLAQTQAFACGHDFNVFFELHSVHFLMSTKYRFFVNVFSLTAGL